MKQSASVQLDYQSPYSQYYNQVLESSEYKESGGDEAATPQTSETESKQ